MSRNKPARGRPRIHQYQYEVTGTANDGLKFATDVLASTPEQASEFALEQMSDTAWKVRVTGIVKTGYVLVLESEVT